MKYDKRLGMGMQSLMIPYSMAYLVGWVILFYIWVFVGLPVGPGTLHSTPIKKTVLSKVPKAIRLSFYDSQTGRNAL